MTDHDTELRCPDHTTELVPSPLEGLLFCPTPDCRWWHGWPRKASFVVEATIERSEELRVDRLGPGQDDVEDPEIIRPIWAPVKGLGSF